MERWNMQPGEDTLQIQGSWSSLLKKKAKIAVGEEYRGKSPSIFVLSVNGVD